MRTSRLDSVASRALARTDVSRRTDRDRLLNLSGLAGGRGSRLTDATQQATGGPPSGFPPARSPWVADE